MLDNKNMIKNFLTFKVESILGGIFIVAIAGFFIGYMFISVKNFDTDVSLMNSDGVSVKNVTDTERALIDMWVRENHVTLPPDLGYRYIIKEYPSKPWLNDSSL